MSRGSRKLLVCGAVSGMAAALLVVPGAADAAGRGTTLTAKDNGDCTVTFTLTNYTNSTYYQPDWWFEQEGPAPANSTPADVVLTPPWRRVPSTGTTWPFARWIGSPPLHSEVGEGVPVFTPPSGPSYSGTAQPDGFVSTRTMNPKQAENPSPPAVGADGSYTIWFRINNGPATADRVPQASVKVTGCASPGGSGSSGSSTGSLHLGSLGELFPKS